MTTTKHTIQLRGNRLMPGGTTELGLERILCNDIHLPIPKGGFNPHNVRLWVIGNEFGALGAVWASCEQDALDELVDSGLGDGLLVDEDHVKSLDQAEQDELAHLGNAGEPADLTYCWMAEADIANDIPLLLMFAQARGAGAKTLDNI